MEHHRTVIAGQDTLTRVQKIMIDTLGCEPCAVTLDALLVPDHEDGGRLRDSDRPHLDCDSLDVVELVMSFEDEFRIEITDDEGERLNRGTVKDCVDLIDRKLAP